MVVFGKQQRFHVRIVTKLIAAFEGVSRPALSEAGSSQVRKVLVQHHFRVFSKRFWKQLSCRYVLRAAQGDRLRMTGRLSGSVPVKSVLSWTALLPFVCVLIVVAGSLYLWDRVRFRLHARKSFQPVENKNCFVEAHLRRTEDLRDCARSVPA